MAQLDHLAGVQAFVEAARHLNFTEAARTLGVTKSAVGKSVSRLEARLGTQLIHRSTRRLVLTADGEAYLAVARRALEEIGAAETSLASGNRDIVGRLRVDAPAAWGREVLLPILFGITQEHPGLHLSLSFTDRIIDPIEERVDLVIRFGETPDTSGLITRKLAEQRAPLVAAPGYLARKGAPSTPEDLHHHDCITGVRRDVPTGYRIARGDGQPERLHVLATHEIGDGSAVVEAAMAGLGIAQMPLSLVARPLAEGRLVEVLPEYGIAPVGIYALWPETRHLLARIRYVVDVLARHGQQGTL
ncbi:LysR family transcriptional regulator [Paenirhodobacter populi]|uniref:LysR family transcriptional regulator n=1 Tax=Paenirhodobacter populi TaxID=2306993 RepID=A0A443JRA6_9RHOB|nr:LysR family transcriptional regulator [Sinirhodobacter populi]RWR23002.1 LysR family transcriptional regulator [Sinirhodobacter populi]